MTRFAVTIIALSMVQCERQSETAPTVVAASGTPASPSASAPPGRSGAKRPKRVPVKAPKGFVEMTVKAVFPSSEGNAVMLVDAREKRALLVFVGETEALSIHLRLQGEEYTRPLTHDLMDEILESLGARVHSARVDRLDNDIFYGVVSIAKGDTVRDYDSRTSDAIAMALGSNAPIFVARDVLERAGVDLDDSGMPKASASATVDSGHSPISL